MGKRKWASLWGAVIVAASAIAGLGVAAPAAAAPVPVSCDYANPDGGGKYPGSICWFDFAGYDQTLGASDAGQDFVMSLGAYQVSYNVIQRPVAGWTNRGVVASAATTPPFVIGGPGYYEGIGGSPWLYSTAGQAFGAVTIGIRNVQVTLNGAPVSGYELVTAAPETPDAAVGNFAEYLVFNSDQPLTLIDSGAPTPNGGCGFPPAGNGTQTVYCNPVGAGPTQGVLGAIFSAPSATRISGAVYMSTGGEREALGFGIRTATIELDKQVTGRIDPADAFDLAITSPESAVVGSATTATANSATTGILPIIPSGTFTLGESVTAGSPSPLDYYDPSWLCTNAVADSTTELPTGTGATQQIAPVPGDVIACVVTNTPKPTGLALEKTVDVETSKAGDTVTYRFLVTNTGQLPLSTLSISETSFTGTGTLSAPVCPVTTLAVGESTTCEATYTVTAADAAAGTVTNEAVANSVVSGTSGAVASNLSAASFTAKPAPLPETHVGGPVVHTGGTSLSSMPSAPAQLAAGLTVLLAIGIIIVAWRRRAFA